MNALTRTLARHRIVIATLEARNGDPVTLREYREEADALARVVEPIRRIGDELFDAISRKLREGGGLGSA